MTPQAIVVHGGAGEIPRDLQPQHRAGCAAAAAVGWEVLLKGGSAIDAVESAIRAMEDNPIFNAGRGGVLNEAGVVDLDAGLMDGESLKIGAVGAVYHYANPISVARRVMEETAHHLLVEAGAESFAAAQGFPSVPNESLIVERRRDAYERRRNDCDRRQGTRTGDTVGAVALDATGRVAAGASTGGITFSMPGRVGDSPLAGAGFYADNRAGGVSCTGSGEAIMRVGLALRAIFLLEMGLPAREAALSAMALFAERTTGEAGLILLDRQGRVGLAHNSPNLAFAYRTTGQDEIVDGIAV